MIEKLAPVARRSFLSRFGIGAAALGAAIFAFVGFLALISGVLNSRPALMDQIAGPPGPGGRNIGILAGIGVVVALVFGVIGLVMGKRR